MVKLTKQSQQSPQASPQLSAFDQANLRSFESKRKLLRDRTISVSKRYQNAAFIVGRSGSGKTHTVLETLEKTEVPYILRNCRMSPMGLFHELEMHPEHTILLDDISTLFNQPQALQVLMAASGGKPGEIRKVTFSTMKKEERGKSFSFSGGIIAISNLPLRREPLADAFASRSVLLEHEPSDEELAAVMRDVASQGFADLHPEECSQVVEFLIHESRTNEYRLDLRFLEKGLQDFRQVRDGYAASSWADLIRSSMSQILTAETAHTLTKEGQIEIECANVHKAMMKFPGDAKSQIAESGLKSSTFYNRKKRIESRLGAMA